MTSKLVPCKSCGKEVSQTAKACPQCGEQNPGVKLGKGCVTGCLSIIIIIAVLAIIIGLMTDDPGESTNSQDTPAKQEKPFSFTVEELVDRYNQSMETIDQSIRVSIKEESQNENAMTVELEATTPALGFVLTSDSETRIVKTIILFAGGDGTPQSGMDIIFGMTALVMAVENPGMPTEGRAKIVDDLGLTDSDFLNQTKRTVDRGDFIYNLSMSEALGIMLTASRH